MGSTKFLSNLKTFQESGFLCDLTLKSQEGHEIEVHASVMAAACQQMANILLQSSPGSYVMETRLCKDMLQKCVSQAYSCGFVADIGVKEEASVYCVGTQRCTSDHQADVGTDCHDSSDQDNADKMEPAISSDMNICITEVYSLNESTEGEELEEMTSRQPHDNQVLCHIDMASAEKEAHESLINQGEKPETADEKQFSKSTQEVKQSSSVDDRNAQAIGCFLETLRKRLKPVTVGLERLQQKSDTGTNEHNDPVAQHNSSKAGISSEVDVSCPQILGSEQQHEECEVQPMAEKCKAIVDNPVNKSIDNPVNKAANDDKLKNDIYQCVNIDSKLLYKCVYCQYSSTKRYRLVLHARIHSGEKPYKCSLCDYRSNRSDAVTAHQIIHSGRRPFKCRYCRYRGNYQHHVTIHERVHSGEKPYTCQFCDFKAAARRDVTIHENTHTNKKPFKCDLCEYRGKTKVAVKVHQRIHTDEKPYKCFYCDYRANVKQSITVHERIHTGENPYECQYCEYKTKKKSALTVHERTHTGEKPYKCQFCNYCATQRGSVALHEQTHTKRKKKKVPTATLR